MSRLEEVAEGQPVQFTFLPGEPRSMGGRPHHEVVALVGDQQVGSIKWRPGTGELHNVEVDPAYRRQAQIRDASLTHGRAMLEAGLSDGWQADHRVPLATKLQWGYAGSGDKLSADKQSCIGCGMHRSEYEKTFRSCGYFGYRDSTTSGHEWQDQHERDFGVAPKLPAEAYQMTEEKLRAIRKQAWKK